MQITLLSEGKKKKENILGDTTSFIITENESLFIPLFKGNNPG